MRISDWSSDVCSSDLAGPELLRDAVVILAARVGVADQQRDRRAGGPSLVHTGQDLDGIGFVPRRSVPRAPGRATRKVVGEVARRDRDVRRAAIRSEEHTSELQSLMRISYAVFCLKKKTNQKQQ